MESKKLDLINRTLRNTLPDQLENLISIKNFLELNSKQQESQLVAAGLTGWRKQILEAIDEVRLAIGLCLFS